MSGLPPPGIVHVATIFRVRKLTTEIVPAWNLRTLYVTNDAGNSLTVIDPRTGKPGRTIPVDDPYNMYFTPDGRNAIVVAERLHRLDFRNARTFALHHSLSVPCLGWDTPTPEVSSAGRRISGRAVGHLGFTGTSLWIDLERDAHVILLTNRVHPRRDNEAIKALRPAVHDAVWEGLDT